MTPREREILRYLGYHGAQPPEEVMQAIARLAPRVDEAAAPKSVQLTLPREQVPWENETVCRALSGCDIAVLFAVTLGAQVDRLLARAASENMSDAVILQAVATARIEEECDALQARAARAAGLFARPRVSPGYGDFEIGAQVLFTRMLDTPRKIGLTLTDGMMLAPTKSVTALFGLCAQREAHPKEKCACCTKRDCAFRVT